MRAARWRDDLRELPRWLLLAGALHALWLLAGRAGTQELPRPVQPAAPPAEALITLEEPPAGFGAEPGGGSLVPEPRAAERALPEQPGPMPRAVRIAAPPSERARPPAPAAGGSTESDAEPETGVDPVLDGPGAELAMRPKPARRSLLAAPVPAGAGSPNPSGSRASTSRALGPGVGAHGGPGGFGTGAVSNGFDFGGRSGAFRGDVCFFQPKVDSISEIHECPRAAVFFTDRFDVSPRRFDRGFPGVSQRIEWFAIRFTGEFSVASSAEYRFRLISDDGALLYIDDQLVIDNDGRHPPRTETRSRHLEAGTHRLFLSYFQGPREWVALQLFVTAPGGRERLFGPHI